MYDGDAEISSDNINTLLAASNNKVQPYWPALFSGLLKNGRIESLVFTANPGSSAGAGASVAAAPSAGGDAPGNMSSF